MKGLASKLHSCVGERSHSHVDFPVLVAETTAAEYDRVQDGPEAFCHGFPVESHPTSVREPRSLATRRTAARRSPRVPGRNHLDLEDRRALEIFTRAISLFYNLLATTQGMDRVGRAARSLADSANAHGPAKTAALVPGDGRRDVFARKKRGADVGNTKRGKGTKIMLLVDGRGTPISAMTTTASHAEVSCIETLVDVQVAGPRPKRLLYDKAADADWLRDALERRDMQLICPHRSNRKKPPRQDGRSLRRYRHRWIVERTISWLQNSRRLIIRHEYYPHLFDGFVTLACLLLALKWF